jgi:hypothetical protein
MMFPSVSNNYEHLCPVVKFNFLNIRSPELYLNIQFAQRSKHFIGAMRKEGVRGGAVG